MRIEGGRAGAAPRWAVPATLAILALEGVACGGGKDTLHACNAEGVVCGQSQKEMSAATCPSGTTAIASCPTANALAYCTTSSATVYVYDASAVSQLLDACTTNNGEWHGSTDTATPTTPTDAILKCRDVCYANALVCQAGCDAAVPDCQLRCAQDRDSCVASCG